MYREPMILNEKFVLDKKFLQNFTRTDIFFTNEIIDQTQVIK